VLAPHLYQAEPPHDINVITFVPARVLACTNELGVDLSSFIYFLHHTAPSSSSLISLHLAFVHLFLSFLYLISSSLISLQAGGCDSPAGADADRQAAWPSTRGGREVAGQARRLTDGVAVPCEGWETQRQLGWHRRTGSQCGSGLEVTM
jgi:hypothetical protein